MSPEDGWQIIGIQGGKRLGINTAVLEEKHTAISMLALYVRDLGSAFPMEQIPPIFQLSLDLLGFLFHDGTRFAAASCLPFIFSSLKSSGVAGILFFINIGRT